ncbi:hypothetical protein K439DRAFT_1397563, partial [Ramaria rubella]
MPVRICVNASWGQTGTCYRSPHYLTGFLSGSMVHKNKRSVANNNHPVHISPAGNLSTLNVSPLQPLFSDLDSKASVLYSMDSNSTILASSLFPATPSCHTPAQNLDENTTTVSTTHPVYADSSVSIMSPGDAIAGIEKSLHEMNMLSYRVRDQIQATLVSDTTTDANYARYVRDYEFWWAKNEAHLCKDNPARTPIPPFPITAGKVILFLDYELKRPKRKRGNNDESMEGTTVGSSVIRGAVSALERMRCRDAHLYPKDPEARIPLRSDDRIKRAEAAVKHHEPERVAKAQILKAVGSSADTYTVDELIDISKWCLTEPRTRNSLTTYLHDRSMHLMCTATAFRGDNARELGLSDLFLREVPNVHAGYDVKIMSLRILCDNAKHNQSGKIEEQGMIRHRIPSLCAIGALGMHLFSLFHIAGQTMELEPDFSPAAQEAGFGEFGRRAWYDYKTYFAANISQ